MKQVERPATVLVTAFHHDCHDLTDARIGINAGLS
jgi:hypothetical protein